MATDKTNNLTAFLTNTADAIRTAEGSTAAIDPQDFEAKITALKLSTQTADADATAGDILKDKTAYVDGVKVTGTIETKTSSNLTTSGATVTVPAGYYASDASKSVATGAYSASHTLTAGAGSVSASSDNVVLGTKTTTKPTSGHYITTTGSGTVSATGTATVGTAGYIAKGSKTSTSSSKSSNTATAYYPVQDASYSASVALTAGAGSAATTSDNVSLTTASSKPTSGYYITTTGSGTVSAVGTATVGTEGYLETGSKSSSSSSKSSNTATKYYTLPSGGITVTGGALSGGSAVTPTVTLSSGSDTNMSNISAGSKDTTNYPYYFKVNGASSSGSSTVTRAAVTKTQAEGYINEQLTASNVIDSTSKTVTVNAGSGSTYVGLKSASLGASGTASATTTVAPGTVSIANKSASVSGKTQITANPTTDTSKISTYYMAVNATAAANSTGTTSTISGTASASVSGAGYAPTSLTGSGSVSGTATAKTSEKTSSTYYIPIASGSAATPATSISVTPSISIDSAGKITASASGSKSVTPTVSAGYVSSGTAGTVSVSGSNTKQLTTKGATTITPSTSSQTAVASGVYTTGAITVAAVPTQTKSATPTTSAQTVSPDSGKFLSSVTVNAIPSNYVNVTNITKDSDDLTTNGATVSAPAGYYPDGASKSIANVSGSIGGSASAGTATAAISNTDSMRTVSSPSGTAGTDYFRVKATATGTAGSYTPKYTVSSAGYLGSTVTGSAQSVSVNGDSTGKTINIPKASFTVDGRSVKVTSTGGGYVKDGTTVGTISSSYIIPSGTKTISSSGTHDVTSYANVSVGSGSYSASGGELTAGSGSASASGTGISLGTATSTKPNSGNYITVQGSGTVNRAAITKSASAGYVSTGSATVSSATSATSTTATLYYPISSNVVDTSAGDATAAQILSGKKAYVDGALITGSMTNRGAVAPTALNAGSSYTIPAGYHNGSGTVTTNSLASQTAGSASAGEILSGKTAYVYGSKLTGTMANNGAITATLDPGGTYTIPAGYHNGQGRITAANGYALSGTWELTASTVYTKRQSSTLTASDADCSLQFGDDGVAGGIGLTFDNSGMRIGGSLVFSYYQYTTYGIGWACELDASTYPDAYLEFNQACTVSEAFYNYFTSIATQVSSSDNSIPTGTLTITNGKAYNFNIILPQYVNGNLVTTSEYSTGTGSGNITYNNVVLNMPITWFASGIKLVTSSSFSNKFDDYVYSSGYKVTMVYNLLASSATVSVTTYDCCFAPESQVLMADGNTKAVVDVEIGDKVLTYNEISGEQETNEVTALGNVKLQDFTQITMANGDIIKMNKYHPLWTEDGWKSLTRHENMPELTEKDKLLTTNGEYMAIDSIETINDMELKTYYTLKVANNNNFYVNGYLAQGKDKD